MIALFTLDFAESVFSPSNSLPCDKTTCLWCLSQPLVVVTILVDSPSSKLQHVLNWQIRDLCVREYSSLYHSLHGGLLDTNLFRWRDDIRVSTAGKSRSCLSCSLYTAQTVSSRSCGCRRSLSATATARESKAINNDLLGDWDQDMTLAKPTDSGQLN